MQVIDFNTDEIIVTQSALGGAIQGGANTDKFPSLRSMPEEERIEMGRALSVLLAVMNANVAKEAVAQAVKLGKPVEAAPSVYVPSDKLLVP